MPEETSSYIHGSSPEEQHRLTQMNELINQRCLQRLALEGHERVLDVGSGLGQFTIAMGKALSHGGSCLGVERDAHQLKIARENLKVAGISNVSFRAGEAEHLPLDESEWSGFDVVHARFVLEHLPHPESAVAEMVKAVKSGGKVVVEDDDHSSFVLFPEPEGFRNLWTAYMHSYEVLGNDPNIGRRLVSLLYQSHLTQIKNDVVFFGDCAGSIHFRTYASNLMGVINSARQVMIDGELITATDFDMAMDNLREWADLKDAALWYTIFWAEGRKA